MIIAIDRNIPMPPKPRHFSPQPAYPWAEMEIGDSFAFSWFVCAPQNCATVAGSKLGRVFRVRRLPSGTIRCWRVA